MGKHGLFFKFTFCSLVLAKVHNHNTYVYMHNCSKSIHSFVFNRNIVSTVTLGCKLDLKDIALRARNAEYNPKVHVYCTFLRLHITLYSVLQL